MSNGNTPIIVFRDGSLTGNQILWTKLSNIVPPDVAYGFTPTNNDTIPSHYTNTGSTYVYSYIPPSPPPVTHPNIRDVKAFEAAVWADTNPIMTAGVKFMTAQNFPLMESNANSLTNLQTGWAGMVEAYSGAWLTSAIQSEIISLAADNNIQLVP